MQSILRELQRTGKIPPLNTNSTNPDIFQWWNTIRKILELVYNKVGIFDQSRITLEIRTIIPPISPIKLVRHCNFIVFFMILLSANWLPRHTLWDAFLDFVHIKTDKECKLPNHDNIHRYKCIFHSKELFHIDHISLSF